MSGPGTFQAILVVWLVVSAIYITNDMWKNGVNNTYQLGFQAGTQQTVAQVIAQSQTCQPFNVFVGETKADLINVACLEQLAAQAAQSQGGDEAVLEDES